MFYYGDSLKLVLKLGGHEYQVPRVRLGQYFVLEQIRMGKATSKKVRHYLAHLLGEPVTGSGRELLNAFMDATHLNRPGAQFAILKGGDASKLKGEVWDYDCRWTVRWVHLISKTYGWSRAEVLQLDLDEAIGYIQEIALDEQFASEWRYQLSELAYKYDSASKTSKFVPLPRPLWMTIPKPFPKLKKIPKMYLPQGPILVPESLRTA